MTTPRISVVIPTHNRSEMLRAALQSLTAQTVPADEYEVIVVADGCTDDTPTAVASVLPYLPYRFHFIEQPELGAAAARNRGVERATAPLILFSDDDMDPAPNLIEAHLNEHPGNPDSVVLGYFPIPFGLAEVDAIARAARDWWDAGFAARRTPDYRFGFKDFCTGNVSLTTNMFRMVGGFCESIKGAGEDYELGYRLLKSGARFRFAEHALSLHQDFNSLDRALRRARAEGLAHVHTVNRHVELTWSFNLHRLSRLQAFPFVSIWRLLWTHPGPASFAARILKSVVVLTQQLRLESLMWKIYPALAGHAYWEGVRAGLGSLAAWERLMQDAPLEPYDLAEPDVDLAAEPDRLDTTFSAHADSVRLWWHGTPVGRIHPVAGAERLSASQFRHVVIQSFGVILFKRLSEAGLLNQWPLAAAPEPNPAGISAASERRFGRTQVAEFDLCRPTHVWNLERCDNVQLLVRNQGRPVANIRLPLHPGTAVLKDNELLTELTVRGIRPECDAGPHESTFQPPVSVIVCTRDRPYALRRCLAALKSLDYSNYEVTVVDNASAGTETAELVSESGFHYIREERPGLNWARNRGIAESRHDIIAYVDDDAVVDRAWLRAITAALDESDAVTGLVLAAELIFPAQHLFEQYGGMGKGMSRRILNGSRMSDVEKVAAHAAGVGANMAFRRRTLEHVGVFDTALDVGTPSSGGGDLDMFHRILAAGLTIRYEPEAIVWHYHRRDPGQLRKQLYNNGRAFGVYLLKILRSRSVPRRSALQYAVLNWFGRWLVVRFWRVLTRRERFPVSLVLAEMWGATHALWAYQTTYKLDRRRRRSEPAKDQCSTC